ncbi:MAG: hypothetical protein ACLUNV_05890 [Sutterella wadsworthensis]
MMPNLSPQQYREGYQLYDNKPSALDDEPTQCASCSETVCAHRPQRRLEHERKLLQVAAPQRRPDEAAPEGLRTKTLEGRRIIPIAAGKVA